MLGVAAGASITGALARRHLRGVGGESIAALVSVAPALFALRGGELAAYHGVEHKSIAAYEQGDRGRERGLQGARALRLAPRRADARLQPRGHAAAAAGAREAGPDGGRRGRARLHRGRRRGVRVVRAQRGDAPGQGAAAARASRSSASSARASPTSASSRSAGPPLPRSCGSKPRTDRRTKVHTALWRRVGCGRPAAHFGREAQAALRTARTSHTAGSRGSRVVLVGLDLAVASDVGPHHLHGPAGLLHLADARR